jgi:cysteine desulfurase/selenocysteine lyase
MKAAITLLSQSRVKFISLSLASNVLGLVNPLASLLKKARQNKIISLIDATQVVAHRPISVKKLPSDFLVFSAHKLYGPTGLGVLYGRRNILTALPSFLGGGGMIESVSQKSYQPAPIPQRFEAGTANIAGVIGLGVALTYLQKIGWSKLIKQEQDLTDYFLDHLAKRSLVKLWGRGVDKLPLFALSITDLHPHDAADILGRQGIVVRAGHHCAEPLHRALGLAATLRVSLSFYNSRQEIDYFFNKLDELLFSFAKSKKISDRS